MSLIVYRVGVANTFRRRELHEGSVVRPMLTVVAEEESWMRGETDHVVAQALYSFSGQGEEELSFSAGQQIILAPKGKNGLTGVLICLSSLFFLLCDKHFLWQIRLNLS